MSSLIQFRASGDFENWLETQRVEGESLSLCAQRLLKSMAGEVTEVSTVSPKVSTVSTPLSTAPSTLSTDKIEALVNEKIAAAIGERLTGIEERLGKLRA